MQSFSLNTTPLCYTVSAPVWMIGCFFSKLWIITVWIFCNNKFIVWIYIYFFLFKDIRLHSTDTNHDILHYTTTAENQFQIDQRNSYEATLLNIAVSYKTLYLCWNWFVNIKILTKLVLFFE